MKLNGIYPATLKGYGATGSRIFLIDVDGITTGSEEYLEAQIMYPIGDKSSDTEIEILIGDLLWVQFHGGDPRYPIIIGYRTLNAGGVDKRRKWNHENIILNADEKNIINAVDKNVLQIAGAKPETGFNDIDFHDHNAAKNAVIQDESSIKAMFEGEDWLTVDNDDKKITLKFAGATVILDGIAQTIKLEVGASSIELTASNITVATPSLTLP